MRVPVSTAGQPQEGNCGDNGRPRSWSSRRTRLAAAGPVAALSGAYPREIRVGDRCRCLSVDQEGGLRLTAGWALWDHANLPGGASARTPRLSE